MSTFCTTTATTATTSTISNPLYTAVSAPITTFSYASDKTKEQVEKAEKHMDDLELDIEFLNEKRHEQEQLIENLNVRLTEAEDLIKALNDTVDGLKGYTNWLEARVIKLEEGNDKMS